MSKLMFFGFDYVKLDPLGCLRWKNLILREFPAMEFVEFMGVERTPAQKQDYNEQHLAALRRLDEGIITNISHMNDLLSLVSADKVHEWKTKRYAPIFSPSSELPLNIRKALAFAMPQVACQCGADEPSFLYWAPFKTFKKQDIVNWMNSGQDFGTSLDISSAKCASCSPALYAAVTGSRWWSLYSNSDPRQCKCSGCGG